VIVIVSAFATVQAVVETATHGAFDFLVKPFAPEQLLHVAARASRQHRLIRERDLYLSELHSEQNLSRQLINSMSDGLVVLNVQRKPVLINPRAESILGVSYHKDVHLEDLKLDNTALALIDRVYRGDTDDGTSCIACFGPRGLSFELHVTPYTRGTEPVGLILFVRDQ
jgi:PAS domain-containing protein